MEVIDHAAGTKRIIPPRCQSTKREDTDRLRSWRCNLLPGHPGPHRNHKGHRVWW